jgi:hypothetical protein
VRSRDNSLNLAKARSEQACRAEEEITRRLPSVLEKYRDRLEPHDFDPSPYDLVPLGLKVLLQGPDSPEKNSVRAISPGSRSSSSNVTNTKPCKKRSHSSAWSVTSAGMVAIAACDSRIPEHQIHAQPAGDGGKVRLAMTRSAADPMGRKPIQFIRVYDYRHLFCKLAERTQFS